MQYKIKNIIEQELKSCIRHLDKSYSLSRISPLLFRAIKDFILRKGKRVRPILLVAAYLGFAKTAAANLYKTALSVELLHDFMLVHDDIIDKSDIRRGRPSMHRLLSGYLKHYKNIKFSGEDLAIVAGDVIYAMAVDTFLCIDENMRRKEKALRKFIQATVFTGIGEFIELVGGAKKLEQITKQDIYRIYDYKTAHYTFASPLAAGAILAGAGEKEVQRLYQYGIYLGRAFQIKDDILGLFAKKRQTGKSPLTDLQEGKKTILVWQAFHRLDKQNRFRLKRILNKNKIQTADLLAIRKLVKTSGALAAAEAEINHLLQKAQALLKASGLRKKYQAFLNSYCREILT